MIDARALCLVPLILLLLAAIATDLRARIIPNGLTLAVALLALGWWWACGLGPMAILVQIGLAAAALLVCGGAFAIGMMGGGDVKLIAALALWLPATTLAKMLIWMAIAGGGLTLLTLGHHLLRRAAGRPEIPYGVAIAGATLLVMANDILTSQAA